MDSLAFQMPGRMEILIIILVLLLLFGAKKLPELARAIGRSISEFRKGRSEGAAAKEHEKKDDAGQ